MNFCQSYEKQSEVPLCTEQNWKDKLTGNHLIKLVLLKLLTPMFAIAGTAAFAMSEADDACIDQLRQVGGPDGQSGTIESSEFSEAGTLVMLRDAGGTLWRCIAYKDGSIGEMSVVEAMDDGGGAVAGAAGSTGSQRVKFDADSTGAELVGELAPGASRQYVLGAKNKQFLYVRVAPRNGSLDYVIRNPDGSELLGLMSADKEYRGQLWQSGDHVVEVINRSNSSVSYNVIFGIE